MAPGLQVTTGPSGGILQLSVPLLCHGREQTTTAGSASPCPALPMGQSCGQSHQSPAMRLSLGCTLQGSPLRPQPSPEAARDLEGEVFPVLLWMPFWDGAFIWDMWFQWGVCPKLLTPLHLSTHVGKRIFAKGWGMFLRKWMHFYPSNLYRRNTSEL